MVENDTPRRRRKLGKKGKWAIGLAIGLVAVLAIVAGAFALRLSGAMNNVQAIESAFPEESLRPTVNAEFDNEPINILLLGSDSRSSGEDLITSLGERADAILVVHIPPDRKSVQVMSIMRDSWVEIPGHGESKINAAFAFGGVPLMVQTVENVIDQRIDHVAVIDFEGFKGLTEALGGVTVNNGIAFSSGGFSYDAGNIEITDGDAALRYVRDRNSFSDGDYQRVQNQQAFMRGLLNEMLAPQVLSNPSKIADLIDVIAPYMATTDTLSTGEIVSLGASLLAANGGKPPIQTFTMPTSGTGMIGDQSVVLVNWDAVQVVRDAFDEESMTTFEPPLPR